PNAAGDKDVDVGGHDPQLSPDHLLAVAAQQRRKQRWILKREVVLGVEMDRLQTRSHCFRSLAKSFVPTAVEREILLNKAREVGTSLQAKCVFVIAYPSMEFGADQVEVARLRPPLALANRLCVLAAQPRFDRVRILLLP